MQEESRTTRYKKFVEEMKKRQREEGKKRVGVGDKPFTGMKKKEEKGKEER